MMFSDYADLIKIGLLVMACVFCTQAIFILCLHMLNEVAFVQLANDPVSYFCVASAMYSAASISNIKFLSEIRYALFGLGVINWAEAIDYMLFPYQTLYGLCYPWLVNGFDVLILFLLFQHGGRELVGRTGGIFKLLMGAQTSRIHHFDLRLARIYLLQRFKKQVSE